MTQCSAAAGEGGEGLSVGLVVDGPYQLLELRHHLNQRRKIFASENRLSLTACPDIVLVSVKLVLSMRVVVSKEIRATSDVAVIAIEVAANLIDAAATLADIEVLIDLDDHAAGAHDFAREMHDSAASCVRVANELRAIFDYEVVLLKCRLMNMDVVL